MKKYLVLAAFVIGLSVSGCTADKSGKADSGQSDKAASRTVSYRLELIFDGPWSFVNDPSNRRIVAIAPVVTGHSSLYIRSTGSQIENAGLYDLLLSGAISDPQLNKAAHFVPDTPDTITAAQLATTFEQVPMKDRYVINLPFTSSVQAVYNDPLAYSGTYSVPVPSVSSAYVTKVAFRYLVQSLSVQLKGQSTDGTTVTAVNDGVGSEGTVDFGIDAAPDASLCDDGAKGTYVAMTSIMQKKMYVDFPSYDPKCQNEDPQNPRFATERRLMNHTNQVAMNMEVFNALEKVRTYAQRVSEGEDPKAKEASKEVLEQLGPIEQGVKQWAAGGPSDLQRSTFVNQLKALRAFVGKVDVGDSYRNIYASLVDGVAPFSLSGKNCKAPLMVFGVS
jgi:hypothetical protein